ncbi:hydrogenase maturation protease [Chitinilyticum aquatile]|uniref:hydrogenase maturation protease n=1 Tax=Chitinilyticum aquatile TaxID=362520 RepID=UPI0003FBFEF3|nr:hydrogenase maturation protease [Chitinilyticum aquatile]
MSFASELADILATPTSIVGIGNALRSDDAVGCYIAERLEASLPAHSPHRVINAEDVIENHVFRLADSAPEHVLLIDAIQGSGQAPGSLVLGRLAELETGGGYSTHKLALTMAGDLLERHGKQVYLLGVAAENIDFGMSMSKEIQTSADAVIDMLAGHAGRSH